MPACDGAISLLQSHWRATVLPRTSEAFPILRTSCVLGERFSGWRGEGASAHLETAGFSAPKRDLSPYWGDPVNSALLSGPVAGKPRLSL